MSKDMDYYQWVVQGERNCPQCEALAGSIRLLAEWKMTITPGFHEGCDCVLVYDEDGKEELGNVIYGWLADWLDIFKQWQKNILEGFGKVIAGSEKGLNPMIETPKAKQPGGGYVSGMSFWQYDRMKK